MQDITHAKAVAHAFAAAETLSVQLLFNELVFFVPTATLAEFMKEFNKNLDEGVYGSPLERS